MTDFTRRKMLQVLGASPAAAVAFTWTAEETLLASQQSQEARAQAAAKGQPYKTRFFTAHEYATVVALADMILPKDDRSGSASDAGAPEFIDYIVAEQIDRQTAVRGGLAWLDTECRERFDKAFLECAEAQRRAVLDDIAFPRRARPDMSHGARFFTTMRDLVATGFWSSEIGVKDIGYLGNRPVIEWTGAPPEVLRKLGVSYE
jgi:gluconate 2-dehydrogenase gamma chain